MRNRYYERVHEAFHRLVLFFHPVELKGVENLPEGEVVVLCPNHSGWMDPVLLMAALRSTFPLRTMAKKQLFSIPIVGSFVRQMGAFPVDRGNSDINAAKTAIKSLREGNNLLIFPEGTRVRRPGSVRAKAGAAMIAIRSGVRLLPVYIGRSKRLFQKVPIIFGRPFAPEYTGRKGTAEEYQANADRVLRQAYELGGIR